MIEQLADYHIHTSFCNHANGTMKQYVKHAISAGLNEMGFADHNPFPSNYVSHYRMLPDYLPIYLNIINDLKAQFPQIHIKIGIELDYVRSAIEYLTKFVAENNFDYIIGSVHYLSVDSSKQTYYLNDLHSDKKSQLFCKYFEAVGEAINTGLFDIIGHFDLPRRFWGDLDDVSISHAEQALNLLKKNDLCIEINTSGFRTRNVEEPFPGSQLLYLAKEMDVPITFGSDAHTPYDVGSYFHEAVVMLKKIGFKEFNLFTKRKRISIPIF
jgi:histidinol-phosphatase (PHP family)